MRVLLLSVALALLVAAPAQAADVASIEVPYCIGGCRYQDNPRFHSLRLVARPGEANRITIAGDVVSDAGAPLTAGEGCRQIGVSTVRCIGGATDPRVNGWASSTIDLGDGDDRLMPGGAGAALGKFGGPAQIDGGPGDDVIFAGDGPATIRGGPGSDELHGGEGNDVFEAGGELGAPDVFDGGPGTDRVDYTGAGEVRVDLGTAAAVQGPAGERDSITDVGAVVGGRGDDTLIGSARADRLDGRDGRDVLRGGAGNDFLTGGPGRDRLDGGRGDDTLDSHEGNGTNGGPVEQTRDDVLCGPGTDQSGYDIPPDDFDDANFWTSAAEDLLLDCEIHEILDEEDDGNAATFRLAATRSGLLRLTNLCPRAPSRFSGPYRAPFTVTLTGSGRMLSRGELRDGRGLVSTRLSEAAMQTLRRRPTTRVTLRITGSRQLAYTTDLRLSGSR